MNITKIIELRSCRKDCKVLFAQPVAGLKRGPGGGAVRGRVLEFEKVVLGN